MHSVILNHAARSGADADRRCAPCDLRAWLAAELPRLSGRLEDPRLDPELLSELDKTPDER